MDASEPDTPKPDAEPTETDVEPAKTEESETKVEEAVNDEPEASENASSEHEDSNRENSEGEHPDHTDTESDDASVILEREEGDGQESTPNRKVDDDEDKRNPQYIPKRGTFYEHDDRTAVTDGEEEEEKIESEKIDKEAGKKKIWSEKESTRWSHDKYNDSEQAPKSRSELISIYGYDIRNEDGPPRARRRRRYGRGPNKYTRNWEDEDAYGKLQAAPVRGVVRKNKRRSKEDFPPLESQDESKSVERPSTAASGDSEQSNPTKPVLTENSETTKKDDASSKESTSKMLPKSDFPSMENGEKFRNPPRKERNIKPIPRKMDDPRIHRGVTRSRGFKNGRTTEMSGRRVPRNDENRGEYIVSQNFTNKTMNQSNVQELEKDLSNLSVQEYRGGKFGGRQVSVPPRLQGEQRGSKRYSSLRQRSLPDSVTQPGNFGHNNFYQSEFNQQNQASSNQQGLLPHPNSSIHAQVPANNTQPIITVPANSQNLGPPIAHQGPANSTPILQAPPQFGAAYAQAPPPFIPAAPPAFIAPQAPPQIINYAQPQFTQPGFSNFQHQQFNAVNQAQPAELYQPQGGITYYSTQNQQILPRIQTKRPKAAIPIVPPPEHKEPRGRGRLGHLADPMVGADMQEGSSQETDSVQFMTESPVSVQQ